MTGAGFSLADFDLEHRLSSSRAYCRHIAKTFDRIPDHRLSMFL